jgi:hypothetical protein
VTLSNARAAEFIQSCLQPQDKRPSATELLANDFLKPSEAEDYQEVRVKFESLSMDTVAEADAEDEEDEEDEVPHTEKDGPKVRAANANAIAVVGVDTGGVNADGNATKSDDNKPSNTAMEGIPTTENVNRDGLESTATPKDSHKSLAAEGNSGKAAAAPGPMRSTSPEIVTAGKPIVADTDTADVRNQTQTQTRHDSVSSFSDVRRSTGSRVRRRVFGSIGSGDAIFSISPPASVQGSPGKKRRAASDTHDDASVSNSIDTENVASGSLLDTGTGISDVAGVPSSGTVSGSGTDRGTEAGAGAVISEEERGKGHRAEGAVQSHTAAAGTQAALAGPVIVSDVLDHPANPKSLVFLIRVPVGLNEHRWEVELEFEFDLEADDVQAIAMEMRECDELVNVPLEPVNITTAFDRIVSAARRVLSAGLGTDSDRALGGVELAPQYRDAQSQASLAIRSISLALFQAQAEAESDNSDPSAKLRWQSLRKLRQKYQRPSGPTATTNAGTGTGSGADSGIDSSYSNYQNAIQDIRAMTQGNALGVAVHTNGQNQPSNTNTYRQALGTSRSEHSEPSATNAFPRSNSFTSLGAGNGNGNGNNNGNGNGGVGGLIESKSDGVNSQRYYAPGNWDPALGARQLSQSQSFQSQQQLSIPRVHSDHSAGSTFSASAMGDPLSGSGPNNGPITTGYTGPMPVDEFGVEYDYDQEDHQYYDDFIEDEENDPVYIEIMAKHNETMQRYGVSTSS